MRIVLLFAALCSCIGACNDAGTKHEGTPVKATKDTSIAPREVKTALDAAPALRQADSLQIIYYDNPDGDSLRYARFFRYTVSKDTAVIDGLLANLHQPVEQRDGNKNCRSEGKIFVFAKQAVLKTIYFSTRCDTCCYLYFINDGKFNYCGLDSRLKTALKENRKISREP